MNNPDDIWETLKLNFQVIGHTQKAHAINEFHNIRIRHDEDLLAFIARFEDYYKKVEEAGEKWLNLIEFISLYKIFLLSMIL